MSNNCSPPDGQWYAKHRLVAIALSALAELNPVWAECIRSLLQEKDEPIKELRQERDDLRRERDYQPKGWDNDGSSNADCHDREYAAYRLGIS